jgi:hypothetical protein
MPLRSPRFAGNARLEKAALNNPPMACGETGEPVRLLQQALLDLGFPMPISVRRFGSPDGIYGNETVTKVRSFQHTHRLAPDGIAGRETWTKLDELLPRAADPLPPLPAGNKFTHRIKVHLRTINTPTVPEYTQLYHAQRVYAQYQIDFQIATGMSLLLPDGDQITLSDVDTECNWDEDSDEQQSLYKQGKIGVEANEIIAFFVKSIKDSKNKTVNGCAGHDPTRPAVLVASTGSKWTLGHEVGHVLLGSGFRPVHMDADLTNLMHGPTTEITADPPGLTTDQVKQIKASKFCKKI